MTFRPALPISGIAGWALLGRTRQSQEETFVSSGEVARDIAYFKDNIANVETAEQLVSDRRLLKVALGAFGLSEDLDKKAFVKKVLEEGTDNENAFANRMVDKKYARLSQTFGFGNIAGRQTNRSGFAAGITADFQTRSFEIAVGKENESFRLAMTFEREITQIAETASNGNTGWFSILGNLPLRQVAIDSLGLPSSFTSLSVDLQAETLRSRMAATYGIEGVEDFADQAKRDEVVRGFLARNPGGPTSFGSSPASAALTLLSANSTSSPSEAIFAALYG